MVFHLTMLPFVFSALISGLLGITALSGKAVRSTSTFSGMMFAISLWTLCYVFAYSSLSAENKLLWSQLGYFGATIAPVLFFMLAFQVTRRERWLPRSAKTTLWAWVALIILGVFSNQYHSLFWQEFHVLPGQMDLQLVYGAYFSVYLTVVYALVIIACMMYFDFYQRASRYFQRRVMVLALAGLLPVIASILNGFFDLVLLPDVDQVQLSLLLSVILFAYALFRYDAFEILPTARDKIIKNIQAAIIIVDAELCVIEINPFARSLSACRHPVGQDLSVVYPGMKNITLENGTEQEMLIERKGEPRYIVLKVSRLNEGKTIGYVLFGLDITERKIAEQALETQATTDSLTAIANRRAFFDAAEMEMRRAKRQGTPLGLLMLDIDNFKAVNDRYGHRVGDRVLVEVSRRCLSCLREIDIFARYGGEEFVCLLSGDRKGIVRTADRLRDIMDESPILIDSHSFKVTLSIGISLLKCDTETVDQLIDRADKALYQSKQNGRNKVTEAAL